MLFKLCKQIGLSSNPKFRDCLYFVGEKDMRL